VLADDSGWKDPNDNYNDVSNVTNPGNAKSSDDNRATFTRTGSTVDYTFANDIVPAGATINGITVKLEATRDSSNKATRTLDVSLIDGATITSIKNSGEISKSGDGTYTLGSSTDTWGHSWSAAAINSIEVRVKSNDGGVYLDHIKIQVSYTPAVTGPSFTVDTSLIDSNETITVGYDGHIYDLTASSPNLVLGIATGNVTFTAASSDSNKLFNGWSTDGWDDTQNPASITPEDGAVYSPHADWRTVVKHNVSFDSNGGSAVSSQTVEVGTYVTEPTPPPTRTYSSGNYTFLGWYTDDTTFTTKWDFDSNTMPDSDLTLHAKWGQYRVTYNANTGSGTVTDDNVYANRDTVTVKDGILTLNFTSKDKAINVTYITIKEVSVTSSDDTVKLDKYSAD
jgi:uncharacterized repeat protein (TIGR02543 family)